MATYLFCFLLLSLAINIALFIGTFHARTDKLTDLSYALSFIVLTSFGLVAAGISPVKGVAVFMVAVWAMRLGLFLYLRMRRRGRAERFDEIRGNIQKFGTFWISQAVAVWAVSLPMTLLLAQHEPPFATFSLVGVAVWAVGLTVESVADIQKYRFNANPGNQGAWIQTGLWGYSRHPNYFGEILVWVGVYLYVFPALRGAQAIAALASPLLVFVLIRFVSGVPMLERSADERWGRTVAYRNYKRQTSLLIPLPPKHLE